MKITFDPAKRDATLRDRGLDFSHATLVFAGRVVEYEDRRFAYPERRLITIGFLKGRMVVLIWTPVSDGRRIISMRKANDREKKRYGPVLERASDDRQ